MNRIFYTGRNDQGATLVARWNSFKQAAEAMSIQNQRSPGWRVVGVKEQFFELSEAGTVDKEGGE